VLVGLLEDVMDPDELAVEIEVHALGGESQGSRALGHVKPGGLPDEGGV
jgi:hypothetical protein